MQNIELNLSHHNFYCPTTGKAIVSDEHFEPSNATLFAFLDDINEFIFIRDDLDLRGRALENDEGSADQLIGKLLENVDSTNFACYSITTSGMACGPVSSTIRIAVDMDYSG